MVVAQEKLHYNETAPNTEPSRVVKRRIRKSKASGRAKFLAVSLVVLGFVAGTAVATQYARLAVKNHELSQLRKEINTQKAENEQLLLEIGELGSVGRIKAIAVNQLGMVEPDKYAFLDYQVEPKTNVPMVGAVTAGEEEDAEKPKGNAVINQVAQILSSIFGPEQR